MDKSLWSSRDLKASRTEYMNIFEVLKITGNSNWVSGFEYDEWVMCISGGCHLIVTVMHWTYQINPVNI